MKCTFCSKEVLHKKDKRMLNVFCDKTCAARYNNSIKPKRVKSKAFCRDCGSLLSKNTVQRCQDCFAKSRTKALVSELTVKDLKELCKDKRQSSFASKIRGYGQTVYNQSNKPKYCINCGYSKHYEVCHIKAIKDFEDSALISEVHALDNMIALCPNCHWEFDTGLIDYATIAQRLVQLSDMQ